MLGKPIKVGTRYGRRVVVAEAGCTVRGKRRVAFRCDCGASGVCRAQRAELRKKHCRKCLPHPGHPRHGYAREHTIGRLPEYRIWSDIIQSCLNPKHHRYPAVGDKGIKICKRWLDFAKFIADVGPRPPQPEGRSRIFLRRIDKRKGYFPDNVKWESSTAYGDRLREKFAEMIRRNPAIKTGEIAAALGIKPHYAHSIRSIINSSRKSSSA